MFTGDTKWSMAYVCILSMPGITLSHILHLHIFSHLTVLTKRIAKATKRCEPWQQVMWTSKITPASNIDHCCWNCSSDCCYMATLVRFRDKQAFYVRCLTTLSPVEIVWRRRWVCEWVWGDGGIIMTGKTEALGVKPAPVTLFPHWLIWSWSRISAVRGRWQTAWAMAGPGSILRWFFVVSLRLFNNAVSPHSVSSKWKDRLYRRRSQDFEFVVLIYVPDFYLGRVKGTTQDSNQGVPYSVRNLKWMPAFWTHYVQHYQYTIVVFFKSCSSWIRRFRPADSSLRLLCLQFVIALLCRKLPAEYRNVYVSSHSLSLVLDRSQWQCG